MKIKIRDYITMLLLALLIVSCSDNKQSKPNVLIIFPDQFRQYSLGFWSQGDNAKSIHGIPDPVNTPGLDKLANDGVVFSRAMSNFPLCSPFRGMLMTGQYPFTNGLTGNCHKDRTVGINLDGKAMANVFSDAGYETAYFGKCHWHRTEPVFDENGTWKGTTSPPGGQYINAYDTYVPPGAPRLGYSYFFQTLRDTHSDPLCYSSDPQAINGLKDGELYKPKRFNAELEAEALLNYLGNSHGQREVNKPFFVTWSLNPPHNPWTEEHTDMKFFPQYLDNDTLNIDKLLLRDNADKNVGIYAPYYFANVSAVDYYIGKVLEKLEEIGQAENTIIIFTSDHGEMLGSHGHQGKPYPENEAYNIPFIVKWGKNLKHRIDDLMISVPDIMPTVLALAGLESKIPETVQGNNLAEHISNPEYSGAEKPKAVLYMDYKSRGLYTGDYTFVVLASKENEFQEAFYYDNIKDPYQLHRIMGDKMNSELEARFIAELANQLKAIDDDWARNQICGKYLNYQI